MRAAERGASSVSLVRSEGLSGKRHTTPDGFPGKYQAVMQVGEYVEPAAYIENATVYRNDAKVPASDYTITDGVIVLKQLRLAATSLRPIIRITGEYVLTTTDWESQNYLETGTKREVSS